jgi:hypothetical protein
MIRNDNLICTYFGIFNEEESEDEEVDERSKEKE